MVLDLLIWLALVIAMFVLVPFKPPTQSKQQPSDEQKETEIATISEPSDDQREEWLDLKKLEYARTGDRYENIYRAIWQNFSYMAVLAGGILTFTSKTFDPPLVFALALTPLVFWFLATFLPMDFYGDATRTRASNIEREINALCFKGKDDPRLRHFISFKDSKFKWRVQNAVAVTGAIVMMLWLLSLVVAIHHRVQRQSKTPNSALEQLNAAQDSLVRLTRRFS